MCAPVVMAAAMVAGGAMKAYSQVKQGSAQRKYYNAMADAAQQQGEYQKAIDMKKSEIEQDVGSQQVKAEAVKGAEAQGLQRAVEASNGIQGSGTAQDIAIDTMRKTASNEINLKYNADTKSWAFETEGAYAKWSGDQQAAQYRAAGKQALSAAKRQATMTMLSTAASVATFGAMGGFSALGSAGTSGSMLGGGSQVSGAGGYTSAFLTL